MTLDPIVSPAWLLDNLAGVVVCDIRWYLDGRAEGIDTYRERHIEGAVFVDMDRWLSTPASPEEGRHPLPSPEVFAEGMSACGVGDGTRVVVYDDLAGRVAGRMVWMLRVLGHDAALLDGGLDAWTGPTESGDSKPTAATFTVKPWPAEKFASIADVALLGDDDRAVIIDSRAANRYRGETEPVDPRAGHVPGAVNVPIEDNMDADTGRYLDDSAIAEHFDAVGASGDKDIIVYCGSGVSACHNLLALERLGRPARLYVGSWSQWSSDPEREAATG